MFLQRLLGVHLRLAQNAAVLAPGTHLGVRKKEVSIEQNPDAERQDPKRYHRQLSRSMRSADRTFVDVRRRRLQLCPPRRQQNTCPREREKRGIADRETRQKINFRPF